MSPYISGSGQRKESLRLSMLDLPNAKHFQRNISRHQALVGEKIQLVCRHEMDLAIEEEIKQTILHEKGEDFYKVWKSKAAGEREKIGLTVSYDMGWNKRSSGHRYDSLSGHAFIVGAYTRRIIGCVIFSKTCAICTARNNRTNMLMRVYSQKTILKSQKA